MNARLKQVVFLEENTLLEIEFMGGIEGIGLSGEKRGNVFKVGHFFASLIRSASSDWPLFAQRNLQIRGKQALSLDANSNSFKNLSYSNKLRCLLWFYETNEERKRQDENRMSKLLFRRDFSQLNSNYVLRGKTPISQRVRPIITKSGAQKIRRNNDV